MSKNLILILGLFILTSLGVFLFFLPKSVVENDRKLDETSIESTKSDGSIPENSDHNLSVAENTEISDLKEKVLVETNGLKKSEILSTIGTAYLKGNQFDSAGYFFEKASQLKTSDKQLILQAGNAYFEGIAFASNPSKIESLSEKARTCLSKIDAKSPEAAEAKAKIAMTWVNSSAPMKGILRLRELADEYPKNEYISYQLGLLSFQSGQYEKAINRFENVLSLNSQNVNACFYLAQSLIQFGDKEAAKKWIDIGLTLSKEEDTKASFQELKKQLSGNK